MTDPARLLAHIDNDALLDTLCGIARAAGAEVMEVYERDFAVKQKDDRSPVTAADIRAERVILQGLAKAAPGVPVISEEAASAGHWPETGDRFFLVDPLDGTKEFIGRNGEFTVNIALIADGDPVMGVVGAPARQRLYAGVGDRAFVEDGTGTRACRAIHARPAPADGIVAVASRSHRSPETDAYLDRFQIKDLRAAGSSLKFCLVAAGEADLYPRLGPTMEWDSAAGHAGLRAAGGRVETLDGAPLRYGKRADGYRNPHFVARGR